MFSDPRVRSRDQVLERAHLPTFRLEVQRQCARIALPVLLLSLLNWLPYIPIHRLLYPDQPFLIYNDLTLSALSAALLAVWAYRPARQYSYWSLLVLMSYISIGSAVTTALVHVDSSYLVGYTNVLFVIPLMPFLKRHNYFLLGLSVWCLVVPMLLNPHSLGSWSQQQDLANLVNAIVLSAIAVYLLDWLRRRSYHRSGLLSEEQAKTNLLLHNILPASVAFELKNNGDVQPRHVDSVSVLFTDFVGFTRHAEHMTPCEVTHRLERYFERFDDLVEQHGVEKLKTIGDAYMCAGGLPRENRTHAIDCVLVALNMQRFVDEQGRESGAEGKSPWQLRIGVHSGPVMAGVIGKKKFAYDIWGDTVNVASRMESAGLPGEINISAQTHRLIKDLFDCEYRGALPVKNRGALDMYLVKGLPPEYASDRDSLAPNARFAAKIEALLAQDSVPVTNLG